jgi:hypothetical protein
VIWTGERFRQQAELVAAAHQAAAAPAAPAAVTAAPAGHHAVIAAGLPGADTAAALREAGTDPAGYLTVSVGATLTAMAAAGLLPAGDGQSPLRRAGAGHAEAQHLAKRIALLALVGGRNLILDISLVSRRAAESWTYALRFAGYTVNAVFTDIGVAESVRRSDAMFRRGEEEYARGEGYGGRLIPAAAIEALGDPAATEPRNRIRWAIGARAEGGLAGDAGPVLFPGSAVTSMLSAYQAGQRSLDDLSLEFRARRWPRVPDVCPPDLEAARAAIDDPEPYVPGSFDDVVLAYDRGWLTPGAYDTLATAAS